MFFAFPLDDLLDDERCYRWLMEKRWPGGKPVCPRCGEAERIHVHNREHLPVEDFRCKSCRHVFNLHTGTIFQGCRRRCSHIVLILQGFTQGKSTNLLAKELKCEYDTLLKLRHRWNAACAEQNVREPGFGSEEVVEADEMYQNAGEKRGSSLRPGGSSPAPSQQGEGTRGLQE